MPFSIISIICWWHSSISVYGLYPCCVCEQNSDSTNKMLETTMSWEIATLLHLQLFKSIRMLFCFMLLLLLLLLVMMSYQSDSHASRSSNSVTVVEPSHSFNSFAILLAIFLKPILVPENQEFHVVVFATIQIL